MADNLLSEVDQALRAERAVALWRTYRTRLIALAALLIAAVAGNSLWQYQREWRGSETMRALAAAQTLLAEKKPLEAAKAFSNVVMTGHGSVRTLARIWQAKALVIANNEPEAVAVLKTAVSTSHGDVWGDIACLRLAALDAASAEPCLTAAGDSPLATTRTEWRIAEYWAAGEDEKAIAALEALLASTAKDETINPEARERWTQWLATLNAADPKRAKATPTHE